MVSIVAIRVQLVDAEQIRRSSVVNVTDPACYQSSCARPNGPMDTAMGVIDRGLVCKTCMQTAEDCPGHHGHVELATPIMHPSHFAVRRVLSVVACVCYECSRLLAPERSHAAVMRVPCARGARFTAMREACRLVRKCDGCGAEQGRLMRTGQGSWHFALERNGTRVVQSVARIFRTLDGITDADSCLLGFDTKFTHPRRLVFTALPVMPPHVRPALTLSPSVVSQDDLTATLSTIVKRNATMRKQLTDGSAPLVQTMSEHMLAYGVHCWIDGSDVPIPQSGFMRTTSTGSKTIKAIRRRIEGKQGLIRQNLLGKRTDFTARTVITGDPNVSIREIGVPLSIANNLTFPEAVTAHNIHRLQGLVATGSDSTIARRGARFIIRHGTNERQKVGVGRSHDPLVHGDVVERQLHDRDIVIFNRQPSLHRMSLMAHEVRIMKGDTFRMNLSCTTPYNADFDGDEMNIHVPQTVEACVEARLLMTPPSQIISPQSNRPVMAIVQDTLLGCALLTQPDTLLTKAELFQVLMSTAHTSWREVPVPAILRPAEMWTGSQVFSMLLPPTTSLTRATSTDETMCIRHGELLYGYMCKRSLGTSESGLVHIMFTDAGVGRTTEFIDNLQLVIAAWLATTPVTVSVRDFTVDRPTSDAIQARFGAMRSDLAEVHAKHRLGTLPVPAGYTPVTAHEEAIASSLTRTRDDVGRLVGANVPRTNNMRLMTSVAASKGSVLNVAQTIGCVGQQTVDGDRPGGERDRCVPCFLRGSVDPAARGFVQSSYIRGLTPAEVFFHAMGAREGLIDTAVKTSETGYTQRRLVKSTESVTISHNRTVVDTNNAVVQWIYGDDGCDGAHVEASSPCLMALGREAFDRVAQGTPWLLRAYDTARAKWRPNCRIRTFCNTDRLTRTARQLHPTGAECGPTTARAIIEASERMFPDAPESMTAAMVVSDLLSAFIASPLSTEALESVVRAVSARRIRSRAAPGEMVGSIAAQSIGEPATQMTLNTFHLAGCASNLQKGVPRLKELINASASIRTPCMTIRTTEDCRDVQRTIQFTSVRSICSSTEVVHEPDITHSDADEWANDYWSVPDDDVVAARAAGAFSSFVIRFSLSADALVDRVLRVSDVVLFIQQHAHAAFTVGTDDNDDTRCVRVRPMGGSAPAMKLDDVVDILHTIEAMCIRGVPNIHRAFVMEERAHVWGADGKPAISNQSVILTEGSAFAHVLGVAGVAARHLYTNDVMEVFGCLGVEAARETLIREFHAVIEADGSYVNKRHIALLCDVMTYRGDIIPFTRHGFSRSDGGFLARCSFEETVEVLYNAATFGDKEYIHNRGVTSNIIFGQIAPLGTGIGDVYLDVSALEGLVPPVHTEPSQPDAADPDAYVPSTPSGSECDYTPTTPSRPLGGTRSSWV